MMTAQWVELMAVGQQVGLEDLHLQPKRDPHVGQPVLQRIIGQRQDLSLEGNVGRAVPVAQLMNHLAHLDGVFS